MPREKLKELSREILDQEDRGLSPFATPHAAAHRRQPIEGVDFRGEFARDRDRILYSGGFRRYVGKTQVVYFASQFDEHITNRAIHTIQVSQVSRTIGRLLRLNQDLLEAMALGHDLGHPPFGHDGEVFLDELCHEYGIGHFQHNVHGLRYVDRMANDNRGLNLTFQVRDGMLFHDGETFTTRISPSRGRTEEQLQDYIAGTARGERPDLAPSTLEGCVVRLSDTIAYLGQDVEDAIRIGILRPEELPPGPRHVLGSRNSRIINTLVSDLVEHSLGTDSIGLGPQVGEAFRALREFNFSHIYLHPEIRRERQRIRTAFRLLFQHFMGELKSGDPGSQIHTRFLSGRSGEYLQTTSPPEIARDFLATMTDRYFTKLFTELYVPHMPT